MPKHFSHGRLNIFPPGRERQFVHNPVKNLLWVARDGKFELPTSPKKAASLSAPLRKTIVGIDVGRFRFQAPDSPRTLRSV